MINLFWILYRNYSFSRYDLNSGILKSLFWVFLIFFSDILSSTSSTLGLLSVGNCLLVEWLSLGHIWTRCEPWQGKSSSVFIAFVCCHQNKILHGKTRVLESCPQRSNMFSSIVRRVLGPSAKMNLYQRAEIKLYEMTWNDSLLRLLS